MTKLILISNFFSIKFFSDTTFTGMDEPFCHASEMASKRAFLKERMGNGNPGYLQFGSDGTVNFYAYSMAGQGFEINYECEIPCEDEKPKKYCKKQKKKGKCNKPGIIRKCRKTCKKCDQ